MFLYLDERSCLSALLIATKFFLALIGVEMVFR